MLQRIRKALGRRLLDAYKARKQRSSAGLTTEHCLDTVRTMLRQIKYCFLITHGQTWPSARLVEPLVGDEELVLWIGTHPELRKVREIRADDHVTLAFQSTREDANLVVYGRARVVDDLAERRRRWSGRWRLFFPDGPAGDYVVLRVEATRLELMSFKRNVVLEPFGLRPAVLVRGDGGWRLEATSSPSRSE